MQQGLAFLALEMKAIEPEGSTMPCLEFMADAAVLHSSSFFVGDSKVPGSENPRHNFGSCLGVIA